jgi:cytochrome c oxidase subunit IV
MSDHSAAHAAHTKHTNPIVVFVVLAVLTAIEIVIALPSLGIPKATIVPILIAMALVKASLVALYYMHLRYEKPIYAVIFVTPSLFALLLVVVLMVG